MSAATSEALGRVVLHGVSWSAYEQLLRALENQHAKVAYDRGRIEIMSPTPRHERIKHLLRRLLERMGKACKSPVFGLGSATLRRADLERGIEADEWYYIANEPAVRGKMEVDLDLDPPPDLGIEVDVTSSIDGRLHIYAALGISEIWVWRAGKMRFLHLNSDGGYEEFESSKSFPQLKSPVLSRFLEPGTGMDEETLLDAFEKELRRADEK